jgi:hypothetical protein
LRFIYESAGSRAGGAENRSGAGHGCGGGGGEVNGEELMRAVELVLSLISCCGGFKMAGCMVFWFHGGWVFKVAGRVNEGDAGKKNFLRVLSLIPPRSLLILESF